MRPRPSLALPLLLCAAALTLAGCSGGTLPSQLVNFWSLSICGTVLVLLDVIALVELAGSPRVTESKILWAAVVVIFPFLGCLLYYFIGRK